MSPDYDDDVLETRTTNNNMLSSNPMNSRGTTRLITKNLCGRRRETRAEYF